jgi:3',5'-cyclic AMP phosphodiesterase CpdA
MTKSLFLNISRFFRLSGFFLASCVALTAAEPFRLAVLPDTQWASQKWPDLPKKMTEWIVANKEKENIRYVLHVGDLVQVGDSEQEWRNIDAAMSVLDGKVPFIVAVGNHDFDRSNPPHKTTMFNRFFPVERFAKQPGFGGNFPEGSNDNSFHTFEAADKKWLILCLNFMPSPEEIAWGNEVVLKHPEHQVILLTHSYLTHTQRDVAGQILWDKLVRQHPNMSMVFCGHLSTVHFRAEGDKGNTVCEMLFDWQNNVEPEPNSYFALITIDPAAGVISSRAYSPAFDKEPQEGRTGKTEFKEVRFLKGIGPQ